MAARLSKSDRNQAAQIVALFSMLIHAWKTNDFHVAAKSRDELAALGVQVKISSRRRASMRGES